MEVNLKTIAAYVQVTIAVGIERGGAPPTNERLTLIATRAGGAADEHEYS